MMRTPSHLSEGHSCNSAGSSQTTDFLYSLEKLSTHRQRSKHATAPSSGKHSSRVVLLVHSETKPAERKGRRISCAQGVNCRYSVPQKTKTRGTMQCFTCTHARTHTYTHAHARARIRTHTHTHTNN